MDDPNEEEAWKQYTNIPCDVKGGLDWAPAERIAFRAGYYRGKESILKTIREAGLLGAINKVCKLLGM